MDIDWEAIEALAALAGVVGLIASVGFLVYEVRHNARAIEGATVQELMIFEREVFAMLIQYADVFRRGCEDVTQLSETEQLQFDRILGAHFSLLFSAYTQLERGLIEDDVWQAYLNALSRYATYHSYRTVWKNMRDGYLEDMRMAIEDVMSLKRERHGQLPWEGN